MDRENKFIEKFIEKFIDCIDKDKLSLEKTRSELNRAKFDGVYYNNNKDFFVEGITYFDCFENENFNELICSIEKLEKSEYLVEYNTEFDKYKSGIKHNEIMGDIGYINLYYDDTNCVKLGCIKFTNDKYIKEIGVTYSQVSDSNILVEFSVLFQNKLTNESLIDFVKLNSMLLHEGNFTNEIKKIAYSHSLVLNSNITPGSFKTYQKIDILDTLINSIIQAKLLKLFRLNFGENYQLPTLRTITYPPSLLSVEDFKKSYYKIISIRKIKNQTIIIRDRKNIGGGLELGLFVERGASPITLLPKLFVYSINVYLFLFGKIENIELNKRMSKYYIGEKKNVYSEDLMWIFNKLRIVQDSSINAEEKEEHGSIINGQWISYYNNKEINLGFTDNQISKKYEQKYSRCYSYIKSLNDIRNEKIIRYTAIIALLISLITLFISMDMKIVRIVIELAFTSFQNILSFIN